MERKQYKISKKLISLIEETVNISNSQDEEVEINIFKNKKENLKIYKIYYLRNRTLNSSDASNNFQENNRREQIILNFSSFSIALKNSTLEG